MPLIKISHGKLDEIRTALKELQSPEGKQKSWKFKDSGRVRARLARTFRVINEGIKDLEEARVGMVNEFMERQKLEFPDRMDLTGKYLGDFNKEYTKLAFDEEEYDVRQVDGNDLCWSENEYPWTEIGKLLGIVILDEGIPE